MSIVNDALKKAGLERKIFSTKITPGGEVTQSFSEPLAKGDAIDIRIHKPKDKFLNFKSVLLLWLVGCVLIILAFNILFGQHSVDLKNTILTQGAMQNNILTAKPSLFTRAVATPDEKFKLSGVVLDNSKPLAIINNNIVDENSFVEGAKVTSIQRDRVKLLLDNKEITLINK